MSVRVRFAPSPTGFLHIGGLRTALYNFLFARRHGGVFILRIEDTDVKRTVPGGAERLVQTLHALGLDPDEGPIFQSARLGRYLAAAEDLVARGSAYYCYCTSEELEERRRSQELARQPTVYDRRCRRGVVRQSSAARVVRFAAPIEEGTLAWSDLIHGSIETPYSQIDDTVLLKSDGFPTYHLASVVDDHELAITHVIRGDDWIPSTPKHLLLYRAFGWQAPVFAHLPLLQNPDRSKLSKRQMDVSVEDYLAKGYLPEALLNFVALLGWNPTADREQYTMRELIDSFDLKRVNKGGSVINAEKLDWLNGRYVRALSSRELASRAMPFFSRAGIDLAAYAGQRLAEVISLEQARIKRLADLPDAVRFVFELPEYPSSLLVWKKSDRAATRDRILKLIAFFEQSYRGQWTHESLEKAVKQHIEDTHGGVGDTLWPFRVALSGRDASPGPFAIAAVLRKEETVARLKKAVTRLS